MNDILRALFVSLLLALPLQAEVLKNELLREKAADVRRDQLKTLDILDGALGRLRERYSPKSTNLSSAYDDWKKFYDDISSHVTDADSRIAALEEVANALFVEWEEEAQTITDSDLQDRSLSKLSDAKTRFEGIKEELASQRKELQTFVIKTRDQVLFIKHNLNAESLDVLEQEADDIKDDMEDLKQDLETALEKLDTFIHTLG